MTEEKTPLSASKKTAAKPSNIKKSASFVSVNKFSKLAIFTLLIALAAPLGLYFWQQLQHQQLVVTLTSKNQADTSAAVSRYQSEMQQLLTAQQQGFSKKLQQVSIKIEATSQAKIAELAATVGQLEQSIKQRQPSDWLLHEAEYLIRIAARTLWLEQDSKAAIGLLKEADSRLAELNDPAFLPVRQVIYQDLTSLALLPTLQTDTVVLALMALSKQVVELPLDIETLDKNKPQAADLALSADLNDWQANLAKTWQHFFNDFIRVRARTGSIEPLMSPEQQVHLKQNLSLKIQLALWAASARKGDIYQKTITDMQQWLSEYFDMQARTNQQFIEKLSELKQKQVNYDYPNKLSALTAIRAALNNKPVAPLVSPQQATNPVAQDLPPLVIEQSTALPGNPQLQPEPVTEQTSNEGQL